MGGRGRGGEGGGAGSRGLEGAGNGPSGRLWSVYPHGLSFPPFRCAVGPLFPRYFRRGFTSRFLRRPSFRLSLDRQWG